MKEHIVKLLLEQFKQDYLVSRLDELGIEAQVASIDITPIVYDLVGIPPDNTHEYYYDFQEGTPSALGRKKFDDDYCSRDWLIDKYYGCITGKLKQVNISAVSRGLTFADKKQEEDVVSILSSYVDWLYEQAELIRMSRVEVE